MNPRVIEFVDDQPITEMPAHCLRWPCCSKGDAAKLYVGPNHLGQGKWWLCPLCKGSYGAAA